MFKFALFLICIVIVIGAVCLLLDAEPGDGQVGENVMDGYNVIRDTVSAVKDAVDATGEGLEIETHESPIPALLEAAKSITE